MSVRLSLPAAPAIELWVVDLSETPPPLAQRCLSHDEVAKAGRFVFERDRRRYLAAHCALREILSARTGVPAAQLQFRLGEFDKPYLPEGSRWHFNLAHGGDRAAIGIAEHAEIGIDVEVLHDIAGLHETAQRVFTPAEVTELDGTAEAQRTLAFLRGWTRKEACLKAIGSGLSIEPHTFETGLDCDSRLVRVRTGKGLATVQVHSLIAGECVLAAAEMIG
jgi:4'-phosphopantetheinyl transferase